MMRVAVLASASGSNFEALVEALNVPSSPAQVVMLGCNVAGAGCLERAARLGVHAFVAEHRGLSREAHEAKILAELRPRQIDLVCLAGYMRLIGPALLGAYPDRILNLHPSLLPAFPGLHAARQALDAGAKITGCTVHLVDQGLDTGPIVAQAAVEVRPGDDETSLLERIHLEEHRLYPAVVKAVAAGRLRHQGRRAWLEPA